MERQREFESRNAGELAEPSKSGRFRERPRGLCRSDRHRNIWREWRIRRHLVPSQKHPAECTRGSPGVRKTKTVKAPGFEPGTYGLKVRRTTTGNTGETDDSGHGVPASVPKRLRIKVDRELATIVRAWRTLSPENRHALANQVAPKAEKGASKPTKSTKPTR